MGLAKPIEKRMTIDEIVNAKKPLWEFMMKSPEHKEDMPKWWHEDYKKLWVEEHARDGLDWEGKGAARQTLAINSWTAKSGDSHLEALKKLTTPTIVCHGKYDYLVPIKCAKELADLIPNSKFYEYNAGHHFGHPSHPEVTKELIKEIIEFFKANN